MSVCNKLFKVNHKKVQFSCQCLSFQWVQSPRTSHWTPQLPCTSRRKWRQMSHWEVAGHVQMHSTCYCSSGISHNPQGWYLASISVSFPANASCLMSPQEQYTSCCKVGEPACRQNPESGCHFDSRTRPAVRTTFPGVDWSTQVWIRTRQTHFRHSVW